MLSCRTRTAAVPVLLPLIVSIHLALVVVVTHALSADLPLPSAGRLPVLVRPVQSNSDLMALADLRYHEWMMQECAESRPSLTAFRMATVELQQERIDQHAIVVLARCTSNKDMVVGAAELSPIEVQGCWDTSPKKGHGRFYVTDVVTASSYRRQGVAASLMRTLEEYAMKSQQQHESPVSTVQQSILMLLHVKPDNVGALRFYQSLGYQVHASATVESGPLKGLNLDQLAENAGVMDQLVLFKVITNKTAVTRNQASRGKGFGKLK